MSRHEPPVTVRELLDGGKEVPQQPNAVRARVLARARQAAAAPIPPAGPDPTPPTHSFIHPAAIAGALAIGGAVVVLGVKAMWRPAPTERPVPPPAVSSSTTPQVERAAAPELAASAPAPAPADTGVESASQPAAKLAPARASYEAELKLMRSAHTAFAAHEYAAALALVDEHARRFPNGLLAEEREGLRVRSLAGAGRTGEARRAAGVFAKHFPRSVLAKRLQAELETKD